MARGMDWEKATRRERGRPEPKQPHVGNWWIFGRKWARCSECHESVHDQPAIFRPANKDLLCKVCGNGVVAKESKGYQLELKRRRSVERLQDEVQVQTKRGRKPKREAARRVVCPRCGAPVGQPCRGKRGKRAANHQQRITAWKARRPPVTVGDPVAKNSDWLSPADMQMVREAMAKRHQPRARGIP